MISSEAGMKIIDRITINKNLPESDGQFVELNRCKVYPLYVVVIMRSYP